MRVNRLVLSALLALSVCGVCYAVTTENITPTNGDKAGYSFVDDAEVSNTGISVVTKIEYDDNTGEILNTTSQFVNINKTTYDNGGEQGNLEYSWDNENNRLNITPADLGIKPANIYKGDYIGNHANNSLFDQIPAGGAIYINAENVDNITSVIGDFIGNYAIGNDDTSGISIGGAIFSNSHIELIQGNFIGNYAYGTNGGYGGGIFNDGYIEKIVGDFVGNSAYGGGGIYNQMLLGSITGDFINNYASNNGGAIVNISTVEVEGLYDIESITSNFIGNKAEAAGGAIYNYGASIEEINGSFVSNHAGKFGGAIYNDRNQIGTDEEENPIYNYGNIASIKGDFINNSTEYKYSTGGDSYKSGKGGAIYNGTGSQIGSIEGNFINNKSGLGGAIYNDGAINSIKGDFIGNYTADEWSISYAGAVYNDENGTIGSIDGNFIGNKSLFGVLYNKGVVENLKGNFIQNAFSSSIQNVGLIKNIESNFIDNASLDVSTIVNNGTINNITGSFKGNTTSEQSGYGGAISNYSTIGTITGSFTENKSAMGGAIYNSGTIHKINANFENNSTFPSENESKNSGGAIYNRGTIEELSGNFINNSAATENSGGAINNFGTINILANDSNVVFRGNTANEEPVAIYQRNSSTKNSVININTQNGKAVIFDDKITGNNGGGVNYLNINNNEIKPGYNKGTVVFNNDVSNQTINLYGGTLKVGVDSNINNNVVNFNGGTFSMVNNTIGNANFNSLTINGNTHFNPDVDIKNQTMDTISADEYGDHVGSLIASGFNFLNDAPDTKSVIIPFSEGDIKDYVTLNSNTAHSGLYTYNVGYNSGNFSFTRNGWNPGILATPITGTVGNYLSQLHNYSEAFGNMDTYMLMPQKARMAYKLANRYAITEAPMVYSPTFMQQREPGAWFRPYTSIESVGLKNGPKVDNIMYGTYVGADTQMYSLSRDFDVQYSGYIGFNGSHQSYSNTGLYQYGGTLGATAVLYRNNFFTALTANAGESVAEESSVFGHDSFYTFYTGVASKTGYNIELADGKFIIQPSCMLSYTFLNTLDYKNSAGLKINADPIHALNIAPGLKFIGNLENGWQPYASATMVWNIMGSNGTTANNVELPFMCIKPYIQYGIGMQKLWGERSTGFIQVMMRNGGRNGIAFNLGYRRTLGK